MKCVAVYLLAAHKRLSRTNRFKISHFMEDDTIITACNTNTCEHAMVSHTLDCWSLICVLWCCDIYLYIHVLAHDTVNIIQNDGKEAFRWRDQNRKENNQKIFLWKLYQFSQLVPGNRSNESVDIIVWTFNRGFTSWQRLAHLLRVIRTKQIVNISKISPSATNP